MLGFSFMFKVEYVSNDKQINSAKVFWKKIKLDGVIISIDTKIFFFVLERARKKKHIQKIEYSLSRHIYSFRTPSII